MKLRNLIARWLRRDGVDIENAQLRRALTNARANLARSERQLKQGRQWEDAAIKKAQEATAERNLLAFHVQRLRAELEKARGGELEIVPLPDVPEGAHYVPMGRAKITFFYRGPCDTAVCVQAMGCCRKSLAPLLAAFAVKPGAVAEPKECEGK